MKTRLDINRSNLFRLVEKNSYSYFSKELFFPKFLGGGTAFKTFSFEKKVEGEMISVYHFFVKGKRRMKMMRAESLWDIDGKVVRLKWYEKTLYLYKIAFSFTK